MVVGLRKKEKKRGEMRRDLVLEKEKEKNQKITI